MLDVQFFPSLQSDFCLSTTLSFFRKDISKPKAIVTAKLQRQINSGKRISNERQKTTTENEGRRRGHERNNQLLGEKKIQEDIIEEEKTSD